MKIQLGNTGQFAEIDNADFEKVSYCKWYLHKDNGLQYAKNKKYEVMHRVIIGAKKGQIVDHKDGNGLNNLKSNLRIATGSQNNANRTVSRNSSSKYLGVSKRQYGWVAICKKDGKIERKYCKTELEAATTYNEMAKRKHGEFANLNIIL